MADTLSTSIKASLNWLLKEALDLSNVIDTATLEYSLTMADGTSNGQSDLIWHDTRTLTTGASETLDLAGGLTQTLFGVAYTYASFAEVTALFVKNTATTAGEDLVIGNAAANTWVGPFGAAAHTIQVQEGSALLLTAPTTGWPVTAGSADQLKILSAGAASITYNIVIVGRTA